MIEFKRCANLATFQEKISSAVNDDVIFIEAERLIWTNGQYYYCSDQVASQIKDGLMSSNDKTKLDSIDLEQLVTKDMLENKLGYNIAVVNSLPSNPTADTIYMVI